MGANYLRIYSDHDEGGYFLIELYSTNKSIIQEFEITYFTKRGSNEGELGNNCKNTNIITSKNPENRSFTLTENGNHELSLYINKPCFRLRKF